MGRPVLAPGLETVTRAMHGDGVRRLVVLTGAGAVLSGRRADLRTRVNRVVLKAMDRDAVADADAALAVMAATDLAWTTVCAPTITAGGPDGYHLISRMPSLLAKVAGPAVAASLVDLAGQEAPVGAVVGIRQLEEAARPDR